MSHGEISLYLPSRENNAACNIEVHAVFYVMHDDPVKLETAVLDVGTGVGLQGTVG
jgi:hypothetical protein